MFSLKEQKVFSLGRKAIKTPKILCGSGNRISEVCVNKDCLFQAFACNDLKCKKCEPKNHKKCFLTTFTHLTEKLEDQIYFKQKVIGSIFEVEEKLMKQLKASRENFIASKDKVRSEDIEAAIDLIFEKKSIKGLTGAKMSKLNMQLNPLKSKQEKLQKQIKKLQREASRLTKELISLRDQIFDSLIETSKQSSSMIDSKIMNKEQKDYLLKQLQNPSHLKLLYRASQNNFSAAKFHECCDGIQNTVAVVRNQFGKSFAAYTPLKWGGTQECYIVDQSRRSFLLHFDLKQKMSITDPKHTVYNYLGHAFAFGGGHDLLITDKCNQRQTSYSNFPFTYNFNEKYKMFHQESHTAFTGNPKAFHFKVLQYEVYAVSK